MFSASVALILLTVRSWFFDRPLARTPSPPALVLSAFDRTCLSRVIQPPVVVVAVNGTDLSADNICTTLTYGGRVCEAPASQCLAVGENPNSGTMSFDNYLYAMLTTLQLLTMDEWEGVLVAVLAATSGWSMVYFVFVCFSFSWVFCVRARVFVGSGRHCRCESSLPRLEAPLLVSGLDVCFDDGSLLALWR